jgi:hypothetical protein
MEAISPNLKRWASRAIYGCHISTKLCDSIDEVLHRPFAHPCYAIEGHKSVASGDCWCDEACCRSGVTNKQLSLWNVECLSVSYDGYRFIINIYNNVDTKLLKAINHSVGVIAKERIA